MAVTEYYLFGVHFYHFIDSEFFICFMIIILLTFILLYIFSIGGFLVWRLQGFSLMLFLIKHVVLLGKQMCLCLFRSL